MNKPSARSFLRGFLGIIVSGLLLIIAANVVVDPFYRFDLITLPGINAQRYEFSSNIRMGKAGAVCRIEPQAIIMGTSRAEVGLDPRHPGFGQVRTYNLALAGMGIGELEQMLQHAVNASTEIKQAVIALDFLMFNSHREAVVFQTEVLDFDPSRLIMSADESCTSKFSKDANRLIGLDGIRHVTATIRSQKTEENKASVNSFEEAAWWTALYDNLGFRGNSYSVLETLATRTGQRTFQQKDGASQEIYYIKKVWRAGPQHRYCFSSPGQPNTIDVFRRLVGVARHSGLDARFVINPIHARMLLAIQEAGLWPQYEDWKRSLVHVLAVEATKSGAKPYPLWDFSGFNPITTEDSPSVTDKHKIARWFWEPSHYRKEVGDLMLDQVFGYQVRNRKLPSGFGKLLDPSNIDSWLADTRSAGHLYVKTHASELADQQKKLSHLFVDWTGANCGEDVHIVDEAANAVSNGNAIAADALFARARAIRNRDRQQAEKLGVPYREPDLEPLIASAKKGIGIDFPLDNWEAYQTRANDRMAKGDIHGALQDYSAAIKESPPNPALNFLRGQALMQLKDFKAALEDFDTGLKIDPKNVALYFLRGNARLELGEFLSAANDFEAGLKLAPQNEPLKKMLAIARAGKSVAPEANSMAWQAHQERGNQYAAAGDLPKAIAEFTAALEGSPPNPALYFLRGGVLLQMKDYARAESDFLSGLALDPGNAPLKALVAEAHSLKTGRPDAPKAAQSKGAGNNLSWQSYQERGSRRADAGDLTEAVQDYTMALEASPPNPALYFLRGRTRMRLGDLRGAEQDFSAGLRLDPANGPLKDMLRAAQMQKEAKQK